MNPRILSTLICILTSLVHCGQESNAKYRKLTDSIFKSGDIVLAPTIRFNFGNCEITPEGIDSLHKVIVFLRRHTTYKFEIGVHSDIRGRKEANLKLTECRALSILNYLTKDSSLSLDSITTKGYGSAQPINDAAYIKKMTRPHDSLEDIEKYHIKNARVEIKILRTK